MTSRTAIAGLVTLSLAAYSHVGLAGGGRCNHCGSKSDCDVVCALKCEMKEVELTCWSCKPDDFCVPGPSKKLCKHCETVCADGSCGCTKLAVKPKKFVWFEWSPGHARVRTRHRLMKKTVKKQVPSYRWEVQHLCGHCEKSFEADAIVPGTEDEVPVPPALGAKLKYGSPRVVPVSVQALD